MVGLEEDLFPSRQSKDEQKLDEERRLCYVGMTRAMNTLTLSYASKRFIHGQSFYSMPSRFLDEIPRSFLNYIENPNNESTTTSYKKTGTFSKKIVSSNSSSIYSIGQVVKHAKFGLGTVVNCEGSGDSMRLQIKFQKVGTKWLISSYANLELV